MSHNAKLRNWGYILYLYFAIDVSILSSEIGVSIANKSPRELEPGYSE